ncbi:cell filamentation protein Fic [Trinickia symbiotica]|uniref:Cell filamentation protein Fic n=1 Tax=Trinickia symbiotica TaxID=863227 RepID=A0A2T3XZP2_9BURK|nr:Fic family protein [Trinickia symbiotica]PTB21993.1 cell filamentation protein Fic [Trinickia symbiotica]
MATIGYARLVEQLALRVRPLRTPAAISASVNRRVDTPTQVLFPRGVAIEDSILGHLEFALRHEGVNLEVIDAVYEHLLPQDLIGRLNAAPTGAHIRRACFLWEWLTGQTLPIEATPTGGYVELFPSDKYVTAANPRHNRKYRVRDNALGTTDFCPTVLRSSVPLAPSLTDLLDQARRTLAAVTDSSLYERAVSYLYLSETRSSFAIENERPSSDRQERFVQLLRRAGETTAVSEDWLVSLQNVVVRDAFSREASYRARQNWLEDASGRVTFFPPAPDELQRAMAGWEAFTNDSQRCTDALVKAACSAFGFVYLHPFMDGNGRLHRFLIHHVLTHSATLPNGAVVPVSAVILKNIPDYLSVLTDFSRPVTQLWEYVRGETEPIVTRAAPGRAYRFMELSREVSFLHNMIQRAVEDEIPRELAWLRGYDRAFQQVEAEFDIPRSDLSALIRMIHSNQGKLSAGKRKQFYYLPSAVIDRIEELVTAAFQPGEGQPSDGESGE